MMSDIMKDLEAAYGLPGQPNWSFVAQRIKRAPYENVIEKLKSIGVVAETTDINEDCSRCLFLSGAGCELTIRLSLVGSYACIHDKEGNFFTQEDLLRKEIGKDICRLLESSGIKLLSENELRKEISLGGILHTLYAALFSSDELIP